MYVPKEESCAINDIIAFNNCLIACSEGKRLLIWDSKTLKITDYISFDEALQDTRLIIFYQLML